MLFVFFFFCCYFFFFFFNDTATTEIYTLSLHDALPIWGFFALYVFSLTILSLILLATGNDLVTAFSAVAASLNNLGPGLGGVSSNYGGLTDIDKWVLAVAMLLGRLELFTLLVLLTPAFWRS